MNSLDLSLVVPVYNERENLEPLVEEIDAVARRFSWHYELLLVNDGSNDGSVEVIDALATRRSEIRGLHLDRNHGQSAAFAAGFEHALGRRIVTLDADGQNDPADIPSLLQLLDENDVVLGYRAERVDGGLRRVSSWIANRIRDRLTGDRIIDTGCSLKAYRAESARELLVYAGMHRFLPTLAKMRGLSCIEQPVNHRARRFGRSKYGIVRRAWVGFADLLAVRWMLRRRLRHVVVRESRSEPARASQSSRHARSHGRRGGP
jgi:glycosyltransferase involved in cell wall biosynthesis